MYRFIFLLLPLIFVACKGHTGVDSDFQEDFTNSSNSSTVNPSNPENPQGNGGDIASPEIPGVGDENAIEDSTLVEDAGSLPKCTAANQGEAFMVAAENTVYFCINGEWRNDVAEQIGVSCNDGVLTAGADSEQPVVSTFGLDSLTGEIVYRRQGVAVAGVAEKGPFRHGASVTVVELDSAMRLAPSDRSHKTCITTGDGSYKFEAFDLVSPYVRVEAAGYFKSEMTGGLSTEPIKLTTVTDLT